MTHTPGPWSFSENAYGAVFVHGGETLTSSVGTEYKELIAGGNSHDTLTLNNARLIAAAPELFDVLKDVLEWSALANPAGYGGLPARLHRIVDAAIAKAEGGAA